MRKWYCTQNDGDCYTCELAKDGYDCKGYPLLPVRVNHMKIRLALKYAWRKNGVIPALSVLKILDPELFEHLSTEDLGLVIGAIDRAYTLGYIQAQEDHIKERRQSEKRKTQNSNND